MYQTATDSPATARAKHALHAKLMLGEAKRDEILRKTSEMVITDFPLEPGKFHISTKNNQLFVHMGGRWDAPYRIHSHALGQLCDRANPEIPRKFIRELIKGPFWQQRLAQIAINLIYTRGTYLTRSKKPSWFMGRFVGPVDARELRGFVSQYFPRHLLSKDMFRGFVHNCNQMGAHPIEGSSSDLRFSLKCALPYVFEPIPGEFFGFGVELSNSDFGTGLLCVRFFSHYIKRNTFAVLEKSWAKKHFGSVVKMSELTLGQEAREKDRDAVITVMGDAVKQVLSAENVNKMLTVLEEAHKEKLPWHRVEAEMGRILRKAELVQLKKDVESRESVSALPTVDMDSDGNPSPSRWWMSEVAGFMATKEINPERAAELEKLSGTLLKAS